jgi:hypothetical protein
MIDKALNGDSAIIRTIFTPTCDNCGESLSAESDFYAAVEAKKDAGWISQKVDGEWHDLCRDCFESEGNSE